MESTEQAKSQQTDMYSWIKTNVLDSIIETAIASVEKERLSIIKRVLTKFHIQSFERKLTLYEVIFQRCYLMYYHVTFLNWVKNNPITLLGLHAYHSDRKNFNDFKEFVTNFKLSVLKAFVETVDDDHVKKVQHVFS